MKCLILDSNALISLFDGDEAVADIMSEAERILVPAIVLGEVRMGLDGTRRGKLAERALDALLDRPNVDVLPVTKETAAFFVTVMKYLKSNGTPIPQNDVWIAAGVLETGSVLLTRDAHFQLIPMIRVCG